MKKHVGKPRNTRIKLVGAPAGVAALAFPVVAMLTLLPLRSQSGGTTQSLTTQSQMFQAPSGQSPSPSSAQPASTGASTLPTFDAISVKQSNGADPRGLLQFQPGGRFVMTNIPLRPLISLAYKLPVTGNRGVMIGAPDWVDSVPYNIEARAQGNPPREQMILMLQSMLADRFKLAAHWETREMPVYALVMTKVGKTGPQLVAHAADNSTCRALPAQSPAPLQPGEAPPRMPPPCGGGFLVGPGHIGTESTLGSLAKSLSWFQQIDRAVVDMTGLSGTFDITVDYVPFAPGPGVRGADATGADQSLPSTIFTALQEQLGLKLEPQTGPVDVLVIDHVEKPSAN